MDFGVDVFLGGSFLDCGFIDDFGDSLFFLAFEVDGVVFGEEFFG